MTTRSDEAQPSAAAAAVCRHAVECSLGIVRVRAGEAGGSRKAAKEAGLTHCDNNLAFAASGLLLK